MKDRGRQRFDADELAVVLSHYDLGVIESITPFKRGSRRSPKVGIVAKDGKYLLKRRATRRSSERRVNLAHAAQEQLAAAGFPLAQLIPTREGDTCLRREDQLYELFMFVSGHDYSGTIEQTYDAGRTLARFHEITSAVPLDEHTPAGSFHDVNNVRTALQSIPRTISSHDSVVGFETDLVKLTDRLFDEYDRAADACNDRGFLDLPMQIIHGDWHPGNMLFKRESVLGVIDYDSCRAARRAIDIANGALQFSLITGGDPDTWPDQPDANRLAAFINGYSSLSPLSENERNCLSNLMIEAIIGETAMPIAQTGSFGHWTGFKFLRMIERKVQWLVANDSAQVAWCAANP